MNDLLRALSLSAGILLSVVVLIIIVAMAAVKRGEANMKGGHDGPDESHGLKEAAAAPAAKGAKAAAPAVDEISVPLILVLGLALFTLTIVALLGLSLLQHLN